MVRTEVTAVRNPKYPRIVMNLLVALAISLVVNFSHLLLLLTDSGDMGPLPERWGGLVEDYPREGRLHMLPDGHGYIVYPAGSTVDSVYVSASVMRKVALHDGDRLEVRISAPPRPGSHYVMREVVRHNGRSCDEQVLGVQPRRGLDSALQIFFFLLLSFVMITLLTVDVEHTMSASRYVKRLLLCLGVVVVCYFFAPVMRGPHARIIPNFMGRHLLDYMLLLKCSFAFVVAVLYGRIYALLYQQQAIVLENERLKNENLTTRYNMLVSQVNPHFFFNSLNSLSMLVRERQKEKAITYIDQLSYTFRYILQSGQSMMTTLSEELKFAEAYAYLFKIRFADKLYFDIDVDAESEGCALPVLSLQPLIDNAVKHNMITRTEPLHVAIRTRDGYLEVSNPRRRRSEADASTGIGLENLNNRWLLLTGRSIEIAADDKVFTVRLPLQKKNLQ